MDALLYNFAMSSVSRIGKQIQLLRDRSGFSQDELASRAGISKTTLQNIEWGSSNPTIGTLESISETLGVPFVELYDGPDGVRMPSDVIWAKGAIATLKQEIESSLNKMISSVPPLGSKRINHGASAVQKLNESDEENDLVLAFRSLNDLGRKVILDKIRQIRSQDKYKRRTV
jgi:transcriptional regulator with XRE-family HTH domain